MFLTYSKEFIFYLQERLSMDSVLFSLTFKSQRLILGMSIEPVLATGRK
jgi:hypothetical protein